MKPQSEAKKKKNMGLNFPKASRECVKITTPHGWKSRTVTLGLEGAELWDPTLIKEENDIDRRDE